MNANNSIFQNEPVISWTCQSEIDIQLWCRGGLKQKTVNGNRALYKFCTC